MATHTTQARQATITIEQFVKNYNEAEKRAIVSAGGMAFLEEDRLNLNAQRVALNLDFTRAADAVCTDPSVYSRHWQRFHHWAKQIKKGVIRVAPEAEYIADRTHKNHRTTTGKRNLTQSTQNVSNTDHLNTQQKTEIAQVILADSSTMTEAVHQLGMVFQSREQAEAHLKEVCYGLVRLGMTDPDGISTQIKVAMTQAQEDLKMESEAQKIVRELESAGIGRSDLDRVLELARQLMPA